MADPRRKGFKALNLAPFYFLSLVEQSEETTLMQEFVGWKRAIVRIIIHMKGAALTLQPCFIGRRRLPAYAEARKGRQRLSSLIRYLLLVLSMEEDAGSLAVGV